MPRHQGHTIRADGLAEITIGMSVDGGPTRQCVMRMSQMALAKYIAWLQDVQKEQNHAVQIASAGPAVLRESE